MTFIETWRSHITPSLTEVARQVVPDQRLDIGLLAVSIFWPIRTAIQRGDTAATDALRQIMLHQYENLFVVGLTTFMVGCHCQVGRRFRAEVWVVLLRCLIA